MKKLLIANRGEIAVRVIRAAREMGIRTVAVYSEADAGAIHVQLADEAVCIGGSEASQSYLNIEAILQAVRATGADAVHPGYGFLSERAEFVDACVAAGIVFVGPSSGAMRRLGSKIDAKNLAVEANVPIVPGMFKVGATPEELEKAAVEIGFPVMLKAAAGGGGRGMRVVRSADEFQDQLSIASDEALKGFGDGEMMVEKLIEKPRHIEVQVMADHHGNVACLFERECSIQRRHQKLIEESPSALWESDARGWPAMREAARSLIKTAGYTNAGTVEFIYDDATHEFYFLEVNARLQVEHPVTEMITGLDLVKWQLRVARGERLEISENLLAGSRDAICGHAIEVRIIAEDPAQNFLPSIGKILAWAEPQMPGVRVDTGYGNGREVSQYYDSMLAKLIVHSSIRAEAIERMRQALMDFHVLGIKTNIAYLLDVLDHEDFRSGTIDTGFLGREFPHWVSSGVPAELEAILGFSSPSPTETRGSKVLTSAWSMADGFRNVKGR